MLSDVGRWQLVSDVILEMRNITKEFPGVKALENVSMVVRRGEVHAICGENGAGKSTLMKVLSGVWPHGSYTGEIIYDGKPVEFKNIRQSEHAGIVIIHQELALIPELSIAENIFLGNEYVKSGVIDWVETNRKARELLEHVGLNDEPQTAIKNIGVGKQQLVEIAKALNKDVRLLILDEPTAALNEDDSQHLLGLIDELRRKGITCIIISHKLNEIEQIADSITIIRDGQSVETLDVKGDKVDEDRIIRGMVGREMSSRFPEYSPSIGEKFVEVRGWTVESPVIPGRLVCKGSNFYVRRGEIVGFAGLMGAGRTEVLETLFGIYKADSGEILIDGAPVAIHQPKDAIAAGMAMLTEDRKLTGIMGVLSVRDNMIMAALPKYSPNGILQTRRIEKDCQAQREALALKTPSLNQLIQNLSGGNQQKVLISRWLLTLPDILMIDEPTRGIDVGAKSEIHRLMSMLAQQGKAIIMVSSEMPEVLGMSDRVVVMHEGRVSGILDRAEATQESIMQLATGRSSQAA